MDYQENGKTKPGGSIVVVNCCTDNNREIKSWILDKELVMKKMPLLINLEKIYYLYVVENLFQNY